MTCRSSSKRVTGLRTTFCSLALISFLDISTIITKKVTFNLLIQATKKVSTLNKDLSPKPKEAHLSVHLVRIHKGINKIAASITIEAANLDPKAE